MKKIAVSVVATESYIRQLKVCLRRIRDATCHLSGDYEFKVFVVTDFKSEDEINSWNASDEVIPIDVSEDGDNYKKDRQLVLARLQTTGFEAARNWGCDFIWSIEADVLVPPNSLACSLDMLRFDSGYYSVAFVPYPSHSGGSFMGGLGSPKKPIFDDFHFDELNIPEDFLARIATREENLDGMKKGSPEFNKELAKFQRLIKYARKRFPPLGNVHTLNGKKFRRRGWLDFCYPGIGKGAVVPVDWTGMGCVLMNDRAARLAHFEGYEGLGTQDLFINWRKWHGEDVRICCITHIVCDHIVRDEKSENGLSVLNCFHETEGEMRGHLRIAKNEFHQF